MNEGRIIQSRRVVLPDGVRPAAILIEAGRIVSIDRAPTGIADGGTRSLSRAADVEDFGDLVISPGVVDTHVHINEPGRTEWEGFETGTRAAAAGGVTTIVDMPLNSVPATTTVDALEAKRASVTGRVHVNVAFWGGVVPGNAAEIGPLVDAGIRGFKCFLVPSGVDEFPAVDEQDLRAVLPILRRRNVPLLVHAEHPAHIHSLDEPRFDDEVDRSYRSYLSSRPPSAEVAAIELIVRLAREYGARAHIVHVACADAVEVIARAKADGIAITAETCPHYLTFAAEEIPDGATEYKCAPPVREARHRGALKDALRRGTLDLIASDHSPAPPAIKRGGDFRRAWGGIASLELSLAAAWTALSDGGADALSADLMRLARWMSEAPAALAGVFNKGRIEAGCDADLTVWDPHAEHTVTSTRLQQRHKMTPYAGRCLRGVVDTTIVGGTTVWHGGTLTGARKGSMV
jgi:allantoinase